MGTIAGTRSTPRKANIASTGKPHLRSLTPSCFLNLGELNTLLRERRHFGFQAIAHEIQFMRTIVSGWVECDFSRRWSEDPPIMAHIHGFESENIAGKYAVRFGVFTVDNYVSARNHLSLLRNAQNS
jgi:hypothetical protein